MGTEELRQEYQRMTGRTVKPASASSNLPGPVWALSDWLLTKRNGVSLFATGLALFITTAIAGVVLAVLFTIIVPLASDGPGAFVVLIVMSALQGIVGILLIVALFTMLAGVIRVGTNSDERPADRIRPS